MSVARRRAILRAVTLLGVALGAFLLYRALGRYSMAQIIAALQAIPAMRVLTCFGFAAASYFCLTLNDWLGLRYVGRPLGYGKAALAAFVSLALGHNIGFSGLSSGAIRYRFYSRWGVPGADVARLVLFSGMTVAMGLSGLGAAVLLLLPELVAPRLHLPVQLVRGLGLLPAAMVAAFITLSFSGRAGITIRQWRLSLPPPRLAAAQTLLGVANFSCVSACLQSAVGANASISFAQAVAAFVVGNVATLLSHVPGGLGVIETAVLYLVPHRSGALLGPLVLFRFVYYLIPLALGLAVFAAAEVIFRRLDATRGADASRTARPDQSAPSRIPASPDPRR